MKPWEKYESKPWEKYGPPVVDEGISGSASGVVPHGLKLSPVVGPEPSLMERIFPEKGRGASIMTGAMAGAEAGRRATQGIPNPAAQMLGPVIGGAGGAFVGSLGNSAIQGETLKLPYRGQTRKP